RRKPGPGIARGLGERGRPELERRGAEELEAGPVAGREDGGRGLVQRRRGRPRRAVAGDEASGDRRDAGGVGRLVPLDLERVPLEPLDPLELAGDPGLAVNEGTGDARGAAAAAVEGARAEAGPPLPALALQARRVEEVQLQPGRGHVQKDRPRPVPIGGELDRPTVAAGLVAGEPHNQAAELEPAPALPNRRGGEAGEGGELGGRRGEAEPAAAAGINEHPEEEATRGRAADALGERGGDIR